MRTRSASTRPIHRGTPASAAPTRTLIPASASLGSYLLTLWTLLTLAGGAWAVLDERGLYLVFGWSACWIVTLPIAVRSKTSTKGVTRPYDLASPWSFIVLAIYVGCGIRPWFIAFDINGDRRSIDSLFLLGQSPTFFLWPSMLFNVGLALTAICYVAFSRPVTRENAKPAEYRFGDFAPLVVAFCAIVGAVAFYRFAQQNGGIDLASLSAKRRRNDGIDIIGEGSGGVLRQLCEFSSYAYWMATAIFAVGGKRHGLLSVRGVILVGLFLNAAALPIYASSRSDAAYILIIGAVIDVLLNKSRVRILRTGFAGGLAVITLIGALTVARASSGAQDANLSVTSAVGDTFVFTRSFTDQATTAQIIRAVPDRLPWANGSTYAAWVVAPIPRGWWPEKPFIGTGPLIGVRVFGTAGSGVRPGFTAEAYWNFGVAGVLALSAALGFALRRIYERSLPYLVTPAAVVLYGAVVLRLGAAMFSVGAGFAIFNALATTVALGLMLLLARGRPEKSGLHHGARERT